MRQPRRRDEGVALLLALLFVILLSAIVVEYCYEMQVEATLVGSQSNELQAYVAAKSSVAAAIALLASSQDSAAAAGTSGAGAGSGAKQPGQDSADTLLDAWALGVTYQSINEAVMQATLTDEYGKLNLNALIDPATDEPRENVEKVLRALFKIRKVDQDPTDAIIDWLDANEESFGSFGAESDTYQSLTVPYSCKNGPMSSIEELLLIKGITPTVYFGDPDLNQVPLSELLTVHGDPKGRVNINTAAEELLDAMGEGLDDGKTDLAKVVVPKRETDPYTTQDAIKQGLTGYDKSAAQFVFSSKMFRIYGDGQAGDPDPVKVRVEAYVARKSGNSGAGYNLVDWRVIR